MRSKYGNAYWQVGQETLKKARTSGPRIRASESTNGLPETVLKANSGALVLGLSACIIPPENHCCSIKSHSYDSLQSHQDFILLKQIQSTQNLAGHARK